MKYLINSSLLFFLLQNSFAQDRSICNCSGLVDPDYKNNMFLYNKPGGKIVGKFENNSLKEDYLVFDIDKDSINYFHLRLSYAISGTAAVGWVKKEKYLGVYSRVYNDTLLFYSLPDIKSKINSIIPKWSNQIFPIIYCKNKWVYVKTRIEGNVKEGWLRPEDQCSNPYTTCN